MSTFTRNLWSLPCYAIIKPRLFIYCSVHAWLAWPFIALGVMAAALQLYPVMHLWLTESAYPGFLFKVMTWQSYTSAVRALPLPIQLKSEHGEYLLLLSLVVFVMAYIVIAMQLPTLIEKAEKKAWAL